MNTSAIPSSTPASNGAMAKPQQSDTSSPDLPFNRILTRELADRRAAENTNAPKPKEANHASQQTEPAKTQVPKSDDGGQSNDTTSLSEAENNSTAEQLLMVAAQFSPLNPSAASTIVVQNASASPTSTVAGATLNAEFGNAIKPMQNEATSQIGNPELNSVEQNPVLGANPAELKSTGFDAALNQMMDMNKGKEVGIASEKSLQASTFAQQGQAAAKIADSLALAAASQSAVNLGADKPIEVRPDLSTSLTPLQQAITNGSQTSLGNVADRITPHVGTPGWNQSIGQKLVWMIGSDQQSASLTLNPPDLGPLQVVLNVSSTQANASFYSAQPEVREALEAALPKLREMLGEAGIQLGQANVSAGTPQHHGSNSELQATRGLSQSSDVSLDTTPAAGNTTRTTREGMIDTFA